jgi:hypothetical protein
VVAVRTCNGSRGGRYEGFGNSDDVSPLRDCGAKALTDFGKEFQANGNNLKKQ